MHDTAALNEYETTVQVKVRFAAYDYRDALAFNARLRNTLERVDVHVVRSYGVSMQSEAGRPSQVATSKHDL